MDSLGQSMDVRAARVYKNMPRIIKMDIERALSPLRDIVNKFTAMIEAHGVRLENLIVRL